MSCTCWRGKTFEEWFHHWTSLWHSDVSHCSHHLSQWAHVNTLNTHVPVSLRFVQWVLDEFKVLYKQRALLWASWAWPLENSIQYLQHWKHDGICCLWHLESWSFDCLRPRRDTKWNKNGVQHNRNVVFTLVLLLWGIQDTLTVYTRLYGALCTVNCLMRFVHFLWLRAKG